jgi:hypothetical protein
MSTTDEMKGELLQMQGNLQFVIKHMKKAHSEAAHCNPFVESVLFNMLKQVQNLNFEISDLRRNVEMTEVTLKGK